MAVKNNNNKKSHSSSSKNLANYTLDNPNKITFTFLKTHLWNAADILRGSLDASEYRQPSTFEENAERLIKKGMNKKEAYSKRRHYFYILLRSHIIIINNLSLFSFCC